MSDFSPFICCALRSVRLREGLTGPAIQRRLGHDSPKQRAGFYRSEGRWVETKWGRVCFVRPACISVGRLVQLAEAMDVLPEELFHEARQLHDEHHQAIAKGAGVLGLDRETFIARVRAGDASCRS